MTLSDLATVLAVTGAVLLLTALVLGTYAAEGGWRRKEKVVPMAWAAFGLSMGLVVAATTLGVLA